MIIRKLYRIESAHIVKHAYSTRCSQNYHGHSGKIEVFLTCDNLDKAGMVIDFGKLKENIGSFFDMFDHAIHLWDCDDNIEFFRNANARYIILPCNPTAENYAILFRDCVNELLARVDKNNGECGVRCVAVRYHETDTGYAESQETDICKYQITDIKFSQQVRDESSDWIKRNLEELC